jgi:hypothetical protein
MNDILKIKEALDVIKAMQINPVYDESVGRRLTCTQLLLEDILIVARSNMVNRLGVLRAIEVDSETWPGGVKLGRIKMVRSHLMLGLKEAKELVEYHFADDGRGALIE